MPAGWNGRDQARTDATGEVTRAPGALWYRAAWRRAGRPPPPGLTSGRAVRRVVRTEAAACRAAEAAGARPRAAALRLARRGLRPRLHDGRGRRGLWPRLHDGRGRRGLRPRRRGDRRRLGPRLRGGRGRRGLRRPGRKLGFRWRSDRGGRRRRRRRLRRKLGLRRRSDRGGCWRWGRRLRRQLGFRRRSDRRGRRRRRGRWLRRKLRLRRRSDRRGRRRRLDRRSRCGGGRLRARRLPLLARGGDIRRRRLSVRYGLRDSRR